MRFLTHVLDNILKTDKFIPHDNQKYLLDNNILNIYLLLG